MGLTKIIVDQHPEIIEKYLSGKTATNIANDYKVTESCILSILKKNKIQCRSNRKYIIKENYFNKIDSIDKAYFLGLLYADGHKRDNQVILVLKDEDKYILELFRNHLYKNKDQPLGFRKGRYGLIKGKRYWFKDSYSLVISSRSICSQLQEIGMNQNKSINCSFPNIAPKYLNHFVRGYFDGDGSFTFNTYDVLRSIVAICSTKEFGEILSKVIKDKIDVNAKPKNLPDTNKIIQVTIQGNKQTLKFLDWLYKDSGDFRLNRKYIKYMDFKKQYA